MVGAVLKRKGYEVQYTGGAGDEGVDLVVGNGDSTILVQCKAHSRPIGPSPVRELYGTVVAKRASRYNQKLWMRA